MAQLTKLEIAQLKKLQEDVGWDVLERFVEKRIASLNARAAEVLGKDAFEELRVVHKCQGAVEEIRKLFQDIERQAFDD